MSDTDVLISIEPRYFDSILSGKKTVELRRRAPQIPKGSRIWLYSKSPVATIAATCELRYSETLTLPDMWRTHGSELAITKSEFDSYLSGLGVATALVLKEVRELRSPVDLAQARSLRMNFQPPQFFMRLKQDCDLRAHLTHALA